MSPCVLLHVITVHLWQVSTECKRKSAAKESVREPDRAAACCVVATTTEIKLLDSSFLSFLFSKQLTAFIPLFRDVQLWEEDEDEGLMLDWRNKVKAADLISVTDVKLFFSQHVLYLQVQEAVSIETVTMAELQLSPALTFFLVCRLCQHWVWDHFMFNKSGDIIREALTGGHHRSDWDFSWK